MLSAWLDVDVTVEGRSERERERGFQGSIRKIRERENFRVVLLGSSDVYKLKSASNAIF